MSGSKGGEELIRQSEWGARTKAAPLWWVSHSETVARWTNFKIETAPRRSENRNESINKNRHWRKVSIWFRRPMFRDENIPRNVFKSRQDLNNRACEEEKGIENITSFGEEE